MTAVAFIKDTLETWMTSDDPEVTEAHLPKTRPNLKEPPNYIQLARRLWALMSDPMQRDISIPHNGYLKLFAMSGAALLHPWTKLPYDIILVDEAQVSRLNANKTSLIEPRAISG